jgi:hypothetical protein
MAERTTMLASQTSHPTAAELVDLISSSTGKDTVALEAAAKRLEVQANLLAKDASFRCDLRPLPARSDAKRGYRKDCGSHEEIWDPLIDLWRRCADELTGGDILSLDVVVWTALFSRNLVAGVESSQNALLYV